MSNSRILLRGLHTTGKCCSHHPTFHELILHRLGRFGATALTWTQCTTMAEYITHGLYQSIGMYVASICALLVWNKIAPRDLAFVSLGAPPSCAPLTNFH